MCMSSIPGIGGHIYLWAIFCDEQGLERQAKENGNGRELEGSVVFSVANGIEHEIPVHPTLGIILQNDIPMMGHV
jgi:hypothetical protein